MEMAWGTDGMNVTLLSLCGESYEDLKAQCDDGVNNALKA